MDPITLQSVLKSYFSSEDVLPGLVGMMYRQLYRRWKKFCIEHIEHVKLINEKGIIQLKERVVPCLPENLVQEFIQEHLDWAKQNVQKRTNHIMWPSEYVIEDTEYDLNAII
jgi:hypothetical protein